MCIHFLIQNIDINVMNEASNYLVQPYLEVKFNIISQSLCSDF